MKTSTFKLISLPMLSVMILLSAVLQQNIFAEENPATVLQKKKMEAKIDALMKEMTLETKIKLISGTGFETAEISDPSLPRLMMTDGPHGVRWGASTCLPTSVSLAATFNENLIAEAGVILGRETRAKGRNVILGPCVNIHRVPLGGRNFESMGEDPYLTSRMAVSYIKGIQQQGVAACVKHFACNNQENNRMEVNANVDERTLNEIYLPAFKAAITEGDSLTIMCAYNRLNGSYCSANETLLTKILKTDWGFTGVVMSDWGAVHETDGVFSAGLDLEMPDGRYLNEQNLLSKLKSGELSQKLLNDKVRRILRVMIRLNLFDREIPLPQLKESYSSIVRRIAAEGIVLLKNERDILPIRTDKIKSIAVFGPNAKELRVGGGGSSEVTPPYTVTPLDGLIEKAGDKISIKYLKGCGLGGDDLVESIPGRYLSTKTGGPKGLKAEYFNNVDLSGKPVLTRIDSDVDFDWQGNSPSAEVSEDVFSARWTGILTAPESGNFLLGLKSDDGVRLFIDDRLVLEDWTDHSASTRSITFPLIKGREYKVRIEYYENRGAAEVRFGWTKPASVDNKDAIALAQKSDICIIFAGLSKDFEGEGHDRENMKLPNVQAGFIRQITAANPNTVVVLNNGTPLEMSDWSEGVAALVEAWYPGQEGGNAIADVLFGDVNPSGRLPVTFPVKYEDNPSFPNYPGIQNEEYYKEGLMVGYRYYDTKNIKPLYCFGYGLSYSKFSYSKMSLDKTTIKKNGTVTVNISISNAGPYAGKETVQLYIHDPVSSLPRPVKELKGFKKIMLEPGTKGTVSFSVDSEALSYYDDRTHGWVVEPGEFEIQIGSSSMDIRQKSKFRVE